MSGDPETWGDWLRSIREQYIEAKGWSPKEAKLRIRDGLACVRDGQVYVLDSDEERPAGAVPVFQMLTPGGWQLPIQIQERLTGLVTKAMTSDRSPRDIVMGLLSQVDYAGALDESGEIKQKRHSAAFWVYQLLSACEDKALSGVVGTDLFWQVPLSAYQAGYRQAILDLYRDPQLLTDLVKAQAFQSGRSPDELSRCLEASYLKLRVDLGREPASQEVFEAAGGVESKIDECWEFNDINGVPSVKVEALYNRLERIRRRHS